jgi:pseudouridine synthase
LIDALARGAYIARAMQERLQKLIARAGVTSRRAAEVLIAQGRVLVNGVAMRDAGSKADASSDTIVVDGVTLHFDQPRVMLMLHKPEKTMVTMNDPERRATVVSFLQKRAFSGQGPVELPRVFPVGRLDYDAQGLLLLTNDGELAQRLIHPRYHVPKTYLVKVSDVVEERNLERIRKGIMLKELDGRIKRTLPADVKLHRTTERHGWYEITVFEGRNHLVKRLFAAVGHPVRRILRIDFGGIALGDLPEGEWRELSESEIFKLERWLEQAPQSASQRQPLPTERPASERKPRTAKPVAAKSSASKTFAAPRPLLKPKAHGLGQGQKAQRRSGKGTGEGARGQGARNLRQGSRSRPS